MKPTIILKVNVKQCLLNHIFKINPNPIPIGKICNIFKTENQSFDNDLKQKNEEINTANI